MTSRNRRKPTLRFSSMVLWGLGLFSIGASVLVFTFPDPALLKTQYPMVKYHGKDEPTEMVFHKQRPSTWVGLKEVSPEAVAAIIISEDWAFFNHPGFDANQIKLAIKEDLQEGRFSRGASTITQQMVKNVFLNHDKNLWRKIKELLLSLLSERRLGKRKILEVYLNIAEWGEGIFGIEPAARFYFRKSASQLTPKEGAFLAMLLPSPKKYSQSFFNHKLTPYARETINSILNKMVQAGYLSENERDLAKSTTLSFEY